MRRAETKAARLLQIERLLLATPQGLTQAELARKLGVNRSTILRSLPDLEGHVPIQQLDDGRLRLDRSAYLVNVRFNLHEALALHLAARLMATRLDRANPHAAAALRKLGQSLEALAPRFSLHVLESAGVMDADRARLDPAYLRTLETLAQAWAEGRMVKVWHRLPSSGQVYEYRFAPYFIEPYAIGQSLLTFGWRQPPEALRSFNLARIERVELLDETYSIPADFDAGALLRDAWGIWYTENPPVGVALRFHPRVAGRVRETRWHASEQVSEEADGYLLWRAMIAEPQEMLPWIRSWGADVEVLAPEELRIGIEQEAQRLASLYGKALSGSTPAYSFLWAKYDQKTGARHSLLYHLLDVGHVSLAMWELALPKQTRHEFASWLGLDQESTGRLLAFWVSLHDIGKAAPGFQRKCSPAVAPLEAAEFSFPEPSIQPARHGPVTAWALGNLLVDITGLESQAAMQVARALGGHHGAWPTSTELSPAALKSSDKGDAFWDAARHELTLALQEVFRPPSNSCLPQVIEARNAFLALISGLTSAADWVGSMESFFPYREAALLPVEYSRLAAHQAETALRTLGWAGWQPEGKTISFSQMFPSISAPNPIQRAMIAAAERLSSPALVILEAPTGSGKTEAALYLADTWLQTRQGRGLYVAMPTQATSNQMYGRVTDYLEKRYPLQVLNHHLVHGAAQLAEPTATPTAISEDDSLSRLGGVRAAAWFLPRKRTLLAPFGVGTVDQALMSVLQTRHFFVRLFGLGQKVIIFDEVHAYDTYMSVLFQRLLRWLRAIGASVILLSATLPESTRKELVTAWQGKRPIDMPECDYPRLTLAASERTSVYPLPPPPARTLLLEQKALDPSAVADELDQALQGGGCAAVICNRVRRAQEVYEAVRDRKIVEPQHLFLFHSRFPYAWREEIEKNVLGAFGKNGHRPHKAIVIATQVIEQSLDLDFDTMLTDLAPVDLLLQRAGRLHRHPQNDPTRPALLRMPRLLINGPPADGLPASFGDDERVYDRAILLRTWLALRGRTQIILPRETEALIEAVYAPLPPLEEVEESLAQAIRQADDRARRERDVEIFQAKSRMISTPGDEDLLTSANQNLEEENPGVHKAFRALTRLADPAVSLVCVHRTPAGLALEMDGSGAPVDLDQRPSTELARKLLRRVVSLQRRDVVDYFSGQITPEPWKEVPALRYHYLAIFDESGRCALEGARITLVLNRETGLSVEKESQ